MFLCLSITSSAYVLHLVQIFWIATNFVNPSVNILKEAVVHLLEIGYIIVFESF